MLDNVSFTIEAGKHYSLVGINESGKTTITKLMLRMYNDYEGGDCGVPGSGWEIAESYKNGII